MHHLPVRRQRDITGVFSGEWSRQAFQIGVLFFGTLFDYQNDEDRAHKNHKKFKEVHRELKFTFDSPDRGSLYRLYAFYKLAESKEN